MMSQCPEYSFVKESILELNTTHMQTMNEYQLLSNCMSATSTLLALLQLLITIITTITTN
jgi:hypothetical protein